MIRRDGVHRLAGGPRLPGGCDDPATQLRREPKATTISTMGTDGVAEHCEFRFHGHLQGHARRFDVRGSWGNDRQAEQLRLTCTVYKPMRRFIAAERLPFGLRTSRCQ